MFLTSMLLALRVNLRFAIRCDFDSDDSLDVRSRMSHRYYYPCHRISVSNANRQLRPGIQCRVARFEELHESWIFAVRDLRYEDARDRETNCRKQRNT